MEKKLLWKLCYLSFLLSLPSFASVSEKSLDLAQILEQTVQKSSHTHPQIEMSLQDLKAKEASIWPSFWLPNPRLGLFRERSNMTGESTNYLSLTQEIPSPFKLWAQAQVAGAIATQARMTVKEKQWQLREQLLQAAYTWYAKKKTLEWLQAERELLRELARIAEGKRSAGTASLQDEMKAHLEQSQIESNIAQEEQALMAAREDLKEIMNEEEDNFDIKLDPHPQLKLTEAEAEAEAERSPTLNIARAKVNSVDWQKKRAIGAYFPDISLSYEESTKAANSRYPKDRRIGIEFTIPLWFFAREMQDVSAASANLILAEKENELKYREWKKQVRTLVSEVKTKEKILNLYETTLIPQAETTLRASQSAYRASRISFSDLLDTERNVYQLKIAYYQQLKEFVSGIATLERLLGKSLSNLPMFACIEESCL